VETHINVLSDGLMNNGVKVVIASNNNDLLHNSTEKLSIPDFRFIEKFSIFRILNFLKCFMKVLHKNKVSKIDVVHIHLTNTSVLVLSSMIARFIRAPLVCTLHGTIMFRYRPFRLGLKVFSKSIDSLICPTDEIADASLAFGCSKDKIRVIPNPIIIPHNQGSISHFYPFSEKGFSLCHVSRLDRDKMKATILLLKSLKLLQSQGKDISLTIVGGGESQKELEDLSYGELSIDRDKLKFTGRLSPDEVFKAMINSHAVISAGRVSLEAMSLRRPIVYLSSIGDFIGMSPPVNSQNMDSLIRTNFSGRGISDHFDEITLAKVINNLMKATPDEINSIISAQDSILSEFSVDRVTDRVKNLYASLL